MKLVLQATPAEVMRAVDALREFGRAEQVPERTMHGLALALEECGCNIITHAFGRDSQQTFHVAFEHQGTRMLLELRDRGPEFDFTAFSKSSAPADDEDSLGGWGIQIVRRYTDAVVYRREGDENVLLLIKDLNEPSTTEVFSEKDETMKPGE
jgi:anti-sigma regulatory factor (Ser/Thr protein kinase)